MRLPLSRDVIRRVFGRLVFFAEVILENCSPPLHSLQRQNAENSKQIFPEKEYRGLSPNFYIHVSVSELYIPTMGLPFLLEEICGPILGILYINRSQTHECGNWG